MATTGGFEANQFTDANGDVWTIKPSDDRPGEVSIRLDAEDRPFVGSIPAADVAQLTGRLMAAKFVAERKAARVAADVSGQPGKVNPGPAGLELEHMNPAAVKVGDRVIGFDGEAGTVTAMGAIQATVRLGDGHLYLYDLVNLKPAPATDTDDDADGTYSAHTPEGPVTLSVPSMADAVSLAARVKAVARAELLDRFDRETDAAEVKPTKVAERRADSFGPGDRVEWTVASGRVYTGKVVGADAFAVSVQEEGGPVWRLKPEKMLVGLVPAETTAAMDGPTVARLMGTPEAALANQAGIRAFVETKGTKREKAEAGMRAWHATYSATNPTPAAPTTDGTSNHGGEGGEGDDADESGTFTAHTAQVVS